jgi:two-component system nitrogen regulation sensor histidine kinase NtrY
VARVARRIAHEIKNPLTPAQLSAQRLAAATARSSTTAAPSRRVHAHHRAAGPGAEGARRRVRELHGASAHVPQNLNRLVEEALVLFREGHRDVDFVFTLRLRTCRSGARPRGRQARADQHPGQVAACGRPERRHTRGPRAHPAADAYDPGLDVARLEIADNGAGMTPEVKARLFEPYFSTKAEGTGLGLAIVSTIVADHNGFVRVRDNVPRGSRFILEFPARRQAAIAARAQQGSYRRA